MIWSTPLVTQYESQYGPPELEHDPKLMTYLGSGIWSYSRLMAGAILSVTVPDTTIRSAWRGPGANGMTPTTTIATKMPISTAAAAPSRSSTTAHGKRNTASAAKMT